MTDLANVSSTSKPRAKPSRPFLIAAGAMGLSLFAGPRPAQDELFVGVLATSTVPATHPSWEQPALFANEMRAAFRSLR